MTARDRNTLLGFILLATGLTSILLNMIGADWVLLRFFHKMPGLLAFVIKLAMIVAGFAIIYLNRVNWR